MADPCLENTDTVHLSVDGSGNLIADAQLEPLNEGSLEADTNGIGVTLHTAGALQHSAAGMGIKAVGNNYAVTTDGIRFSNAYVQAGRPIGDDTEDPYSIAVGHGVTSTAGSVISCPMQNDGPGTTVYHVVGNWEGSYQTTFVESDGASGLFDQVRVYLQRNFDSTGWINMDWAELTAQRQAGSFHLRYDEAVTIGETSLHSYQTRLVYRGGSISGTVKQGTLNSGWREYIQIWW